ncbi:type II toxin-antitoxin system HicA family toxin [Candidatus Woesearchaeota archaeon]|nr:type II toxin-antitoxin system HicA family toxin [Candidatus Woesearchaeota archaeon]
MSIHNLSGQKVVRILCNKFRFKIIRQKGSHIILRKESVGTVVPNHKELKIGTLKGILGLAKIDVEEFNKFL